MADTRKMKCVGQCGQEFTVGSWECFPGIKHKVEAKTYYCADAPPVNPADNEQTIRAAMTASRNLIHVIPPIKQVGVGGVMESVEHPPVIFRKGQYSTDDPQIQYFLEYGTAKNHLCTKERWFEVYHTVNQKQFIANQVISDKMKNYESREAEIAKKERELNDLLAQTKAAAKKGEKPAMVAGQ